MEENETFEEQREEFLKYLQGMPETAESHAINGLKEMTHNPTFYADPIIDKLNRQLPQQRYSQGVSNTHVDRPRKADYVEGMITENGKENTLNRDSTDGETYMKNDQGFIDECEALELDPDEVIKEARKKNRQGINVGSMVFNAIKTHGDSDDYDRVDSGM